MSVRIGLLGGSFNPIHRAHLEVAHVVLEKFDLSKIFLIPAHCSPLKTQNHDLAPIYDRLKMLELAITVGDNIFIDDCELNRGSPSYTFDTLRYFSQKYERVKAEIFFIVGTDAFNSMRKWHRYEELFSLAHFIVVKRKNYPFQSLQKVLSGEFFENCFKISLPDKEWIHTSKHKVIYFDYHFPDIQAHKIREKIMKEESIGDLVTTEVEKYIKSHHLYEEEKN